MPSKKKTSRKKIDNNVYYDEERKTYYVRFYYGIVDGKRKQEWKTYKTKNEALRAVKLFELDKVQGTVVSPDKISLADYLTYWVEDYKPMNCESTTLYGYKNIINNHIIPHMGEILIKNIKVNDITKYFTELSKEGLSNNTIKKHYNLLKSALSQAVREDKIFFNVMDKIEPPKTTKKEMAFYSPEELALLLDIIKTKPALDIAVHIAAYTGLRREEVLGLKWDCVDFEKSVFVIKEVRTKAGGVVIVKSPKNEDSYRKIKIPEPLLEKLKQLKQTQERDAGLFNIPIDNYDHIFCKPNGELYHVNYVSTMLKNVIEQYNLKPIRFHDLRHTFASIAHEQGVSIFEISKALGHSTIATTSNIYTHLFDDTNAKTTDSVAKSIKDAQKALKEKNSSNN